MEFERPNYYAVIPARIRYDDELSPNEKLLYGEITALTNKNGECWATNKYFSNLYNVEIQTVSRWFRALKEKGYISINFQYKGSSKEIDKRIIKINGEPINKNVKTYSQNYEGGINKNVKGVLTKMLKNNNTSINNTSINNNLNEFKLYNNSNQNLQCEYITKSSNERCMRKSSVNINGKNYCNQHARNLIPDLEIEIPKIKNYFDNKEVNDLFNEFLEFRKKLKAVNTEKAVQLLITKLNLYDDEIKKQMINTSIENSWKSVFPLKGKQQEKRKEVTEEDLKEIEQKYANL